MISVTRRDAAKFLLLRTIGNFLVLFSLYGVAATFGPALSYETKYRIAQARGVKYVVAYDQPQLPVANQHLPIDTQNKPAEPGFTDVLTGETEQVLYAKDTSFSIIIPKIGASAKIFPNVDATNPDEFMPVLQEGIAHAKGTVFPGMNGNIYLFAHSTDNWWNVGRYNAVFYLLKDLKPGDDIILFSKTVDITTRSQAVR